MNIQPVITPAGRLVVDTLPDTPETAGVALDSTASAAMRDAFNESAAAGLLLLASSTFQTALPAEFAFWREYSQQLLHQLCGLNEEELLKAVRGKAKTAPSIDPPQELPLIELVETAPPMRGLEYLTPDVLRRLWDELKQLALRRAVAHDDGPEAFLRSFNPLWNLVGRVTFHLAENKRDPQRPFAFLATYAHRMSAKSTVRHLPIAEALRQYAGEKNQQKLATLLEPVRRAAQNTPLVRHMLDSRKLFQPHALSISQAYQFLNSVPQLEDAGLVVRVPDWWKAKRSPRRKSR